MTGLYIIQIKEVLQSMPLFNLFSPNLVNFTSESESGERRDVYKGTCKSSMFRLGPRQFDGILIVLLKFMNKFNFCLLTTLYFLKSRDLKENLEKW